MASKGAVKFSERAGRSHSSLAPVCAGRRALRSGSRWNDSAVYAAIARTLNLSAEQRRTVFAARRYLQDKLAKCAEDLQPWGPRLFRRRPCMT